jgi:hypothetical protein
MGTMPLRNISVEMKAAFVSLRMTGGFFIKSNLGILILQHMRFNQYLHAMQG